ncbi:MAG: hypothetical protein E6356_13720 [Terrisporobacter othiniensis]|nr:hypothetical protein [Terrisporobacter othiniensis]
MENVIIDFGNIVSELEKENLNIVFLRNRGMFLEDNKNNLYKFELKKHGSYLDSLIKKCEKVKFYLVDKNISKNIEELEKERWTITEVKSFMNRQKIS